MIGEFIPMSYSTDIDNAYKKVNMHASMLYEFVILYYNYIYAEHTYDNVNCNMMEIHTLTYIDDHPGVTSTELTKIWHKSKGAISQTVKKLIGAGYVEKQYKDGNKKTAFLYVTEKGKKLSGIHKAYDVADITRTTAHLVETCSEEDLAAFYRVIRQYIKLLKYEP